MQLHHTQNKKTSQSGTLDEERETFLWKRTSQYGEQCGISGDQVN